MSSQSNTVKTISHASDYLYEFPLERVFSQTLYFSTDSVLSGHRSVQSVARPSFTTSRLNHFSVTANAVVSISQKRPSLSNLLWNPPQTQSKISHKWPSLWHFIWTNHFPVTHCIYNISFEGPSLWNAGYKSLLIQTQYLEYLPQVTTFPADTTLPLHTSATWPAHLESYEKFNRTA